MPIFAALAVIAAAPLYVVARHAHAAVAAAPQKQTIRLPMRDGVRLATDLYLPAGPGRFPTVLIRTPYNKDGMAAFGLLGAQHDYGER